MASTKMAARAAARKGVKHSAGKQPLSTLTDTAAPVGKSAENLPIDPIPGWYLHYAAALEESPGTSEPPLREQFFDRRYRELETRILTTPARSLEGALRQIQILASDLDSCGADPEMWGGANLTEYLHHLWLALFGVLTYTLPGIPEVEGDPHYHLKYPGHEGTAFTLFRTLQEVMK